MLHQLTKIKCPICNASKKGILFAISEDTKGQIQGKCNKCYSIVTYNANDGTFTSGFTSKDK